jgi:predicted dehydrogenase
VIGVGIVGCNYGRTVLVPAFRHDRRCEIVALAGTDAGRTAEVARAVNVARAFGDWRALVEESRVAVVAVAVPRRPRRHEDVMCGSQQLHFRDANATVPPTSSRAKKPRASDI